MCVPSLSLIKCFFINEKENKVYPESSVKLCENTFRCKNEVEQFLERHSMCV